MARTKDSDIYVATSTGVAKVGDQTYQYNTRTTVPADHPLRLAMPDRFRPFAVTYETPEPAPAPEPKVVETPKATESAAKPTRRKGRAK